MVNIFVELIVYYIMMSSVHYFILQSKKTWHYKKENLEKKSVILTKDTRNKLYVSVACLLAEI